MWPKPLPCLCPLEELTGELDWKLVLVLRTREQDW